MLQYRKKVCPSTFCCCWIMKAIDYKKILKESMLPDACIRLAIFLKNFQYSKALKLIKKWLVDNQEMLWSGYCSLLTRASLKIAEQENSKTGDLFKVLIDEWSKISLDVLVNLVKSMPRRYCHKRLYNKVLSDLLLKFFLIKI